MMQDSGGGQNARNAAKWGLCAACAVVGWGTALWLVQPERLAREGQRFLQNRHYRMASQVFTLLIRRAPNDRRGYEGAAEAFVRLGRADRAFEVLTRGAERISL